jgi:hypothetical protein
MLFTLTIRPVNADDLSALRPFVPEADEYEPVFTAGLMRNLRVVSLVEL